ncbi:MAG: hypothetical protein R2991_09575 [Thermoanaerobaculia bacterium]
MRSLLSLLSLTVVVAAVAVMAAPAPAQETPDAQTLFVETFKCNVCHSVASAQIERKVEKTAGPDLGGFTPEDFDAIARFVRKEEPMDGEDHKKTFSGTDEELKTILDWLGSLEPAE